jgi:hypothetical protein
MAERRVCSAQFNLGAKRTAADLAFVVVGGCRIGSLPETGQARSAHHGLAGQRSARPDGERSMTIDIIAIANWVAL